MFESTTPRAVSGEILQLCKRLAPSAQPQYLPVIPVAGAVPRDCFPVVERQVLAHGGTMCCGWQLWEWPRVLLEAEFHAVWRDNNGILHDITPKDAPKERILFLPDPLRTYERRQVDTIRVALSSLPQVQAYIEACELEFEFWNRGARADQHGEIHIKGDEAREYRTIQERKMNSFLSILRELPKPGRNELCWCGSGRKLKKCHQG